MANKTFERTLLFEKEEGKWYVVLPEWEGDKEELQMVLGADTMLDIMSSGNDRIKLKVSTNAFEGASPLTLITTCEPSAGAYYNLAKWPKAPTIVNLNMWLCDVMLFLFDGFPKTIYLK